jgi:hypothetical protein
MNMPAVAGASHLEFHQFSHGGMPSTYMGIKYS